MAEYRQQTASSKGADQARELLLTQLAVAAALADINSREEAAVRERAAAAARLAQAGGLTLIQEHMRGQPRSFGEKAESFVQLFLRLAAVVVATLLFVAAAVLYDRVEDLELSGPAAAAAAETESGAGDAAEGETGTNSPDDEPTETAGGTGDSTTGTGPTDGDDTGTSESGTGETGDDARNSEEAETPAGADGEAAPPTSGEEPAGRDGETPASETRTHLSTVPLAFLIAGSLLAALALFAPQARSITASKDAIALTLDPRPDPFGQLVQALADATRKASAGESNGDPDGDGSQGGDGGGAAEDEANEDERRGVRPPGTTGGRRAVSGLDPLLLKAVVEVARVEQVRRKKRWRPWSR